ncbi:MAG: hypothetical protein V7K26_18895 [Nostoc sp.]
MILTDLYRWHWRIEESFYQGELLHECDVYDESQLRNIYSNTNNCFLSKVGSKRLLYVYLI